MHGTRQIAAALRGRVACLAGVVVAAGFVVGVLPAVAAATDYCVAPNTGCGPNNVATFEQALDLADNATDSDRVFLGAATYTAPTTAGFGYDAASAPVEIVGQGAGQTIITGPPGTSTSVFRLVGGDGTSVHDLTIRLSQNAASGLKGLSTANAARRIEVAEDPTQANDRYGVELLNGGALEDSNVTLGNGQDTAGVMLGTGGGTVRRSAATAAFGVWSEYGGTIERSRLTGSRAGVVAYRNLTTVSGSLIRFTKGQGAGIAGLTRKGAQTTVKADGVTIVGPELPLTFGAEALTGILTASPVDLSLTNSIIRGVSNSLYSAAIGAGQANLTTSYSDYDPASTLTSGGNATITQANVSNLGDARFVDAAGGDYHLRPDSPLIDTGDPATPQGLDLDGNPLVADGNADGIARRDMGAFELQPPPAGGGEPAGTGQQGGGSQGGQSAGTGQPGGGNQAGPTPADTQPPLITGFRPDPSVFAVAHARTATAARVSRGTHLRYTLSEPARVTITIQRPLAGRRKGANCLRPSPRLKRAKHCTRHQTTGTLTRTATNGANSTTFTGRIGRRALPRGNFRAIITATDAAGNRSAPKAARFRIATP